MKKLKITLTLLAFVLSTVNVFSIDSEWTKWYNGGANDRGLHVVADGGFEYLAGVSEFLAGSKIVTSTYDETGSLLALNVANTFLSNANVKQIERDAPKSIYVLCQNTPTSFTLIKYNLNGIEKWRRSYSNFVVKFKVGNSGGLYICYITPAGVSVRKLNRNTGATDWTRNIADVDLISNTGNADFNIDTNDFLYFAGTTSTISSSYDYRLVRIKKNNTVIYNIQFSTAGSRDEIVEKIVANSSGELFLIGDYDNYIPVRTFFHMIKFNPAGVLQWATAYEVAGGPSSFSPVDVQIGPDGNVVTVGNDIDFYNINPSGEVQRVKVSKFNAATGAIIFSVFPNAPVGDEDGLKEVATCMTIDINNNVYFGGNSNVYAGVEVQRNRFMIAKASGVNGNLQWVDASVGGDDDPANYVNDITVTSTQNVYMAASWDMGLTVDMLISKYCQVGCFGLRQLKPNLSSTEIKVYPNPTASTFTIVFDSNDEFKQLRIFDINGNLVEEATVPDNKFDFGSDYPAGVYFVNVQNSNENKTIRVIKTE